MKVKRLISIILTVCMLISVVSMMGITINAEPEGVALTDGGELASGIYYLSDNLTLTNNILIKKNKKVTINLNGYVLKGNGSGIVITVNQGGELTLNDSGNDDLKHYFTEGDNGIWVYDTDDNAKAKSPDKYVVGGTITGGNANDSEGGAIRFNGTGTLQVDGINVVGNKSNSYCGGILGRNNATIFLNNTNIIHNYANGNGGGIYINSGSLTAKKCDISNNYSVYNGGGIYIKSGSLTATNCDISNNYSGSWGGGICINSGSLTATNCDISNNYSGSWGGGVYINSNSTDHPIGDIKIKSCTVKNNSANGYGGASQLILT